MLEIRSDLKLQASSDWIITDSGVLCVCVRVCERGVVQCVRVRGLCCMYVCVCEVCGVRCVFVCVVCVWAVCVCGCGVTPQVNSAVQ